MTAPAEGEGYNAGDAFLQVIPSFRGVQDAIDRQVAQWGATGGRIFADTFAGTVRQRLGNMPIGPSDNQSRQQGQQSGRTFADSFKARVDAALRSLPDVQVDADSTPAEIKLAELRNQLDELSRKTVGVDIDAAAAMAEIDRIKEELDRLAHEAPTVDVRADTTAAAARLEEIQQQVRDLDGDTANVKVDDNGSASNVESSLGGLAQALISLAPLAAPVGAALTAALAGAAESMGALLAGALTLKLGLGDVASAVKLLGQQQQAANGPQAAQQAQAAAQRQISAANQIRSAEQSLADARRNAAHQAITNAEQVANAEQNLANVEQQVANQRRQAEQAVQTAQYSYRQSVQAVTQAEQQLMAAREAAQRQLEAYANAQADTKLAAEQAQIDLQTAQANYDAVMKSTTSTQLQREQAALDLAKAQQAVKEADQSATQAAQDNRKAQQQGVDGAPGVVSAAQQVAQAKHNQLVAAQQLANAERAQAQAQTQGAQQIKKAEQQVADAVRNAAWSQQASAEQIAKAQQQVATAQQQAAYASEQAGYAGSTSLSNINHQLAQLSPATVAFARFWRSTMEPIYRQLKSGIADNLLPGVERGLQALRPIMPAVERFFDVTAHALGRLATEAGRALAGPFWQHFLTFMTRNVGPLLTIFGHLLGNIAKGFAGLTEAFGPLTRWIGHGLVELTRGFAQFGAGAKHSSWFRAFAEYVRRNGPVLVDAIGNIAKIVGKLLTGLAPLGSVMLKVIDVVAAFLAKLNPDVLLAIAAGIGAIAAAFGGPVTAIVAGVVAAAGLIVDHWKQVRPAVQPFLDWLHELWTYITTTVVPVLKGVFLDAWHGIQNAVQIVTRAYEGHKQQIDDVLHAIGALVNFVVTKVIPVMGTSLKITLTGLGYVIKGVILVIAGLVDAIKWLRGAAETVARWFSGPFVHFFQQAWADVRGFFSAAWDWVRTTWSNAWRNAKTIVLTPVHDAAASISDIWAGIRTVFGDAWAWVRDTFSQAWSRVESFVTAPIHAAQGVLATVWDGIKTDARAFVGAMKTIWGGLEDVFKAPIKFLVQYVLNDGLIKAWDWVADNVPGMGSLHINPFRPKWLFADGGVIPGYAPGVDSYHALVSPGEAVLRPEVTRALGADTIHGWNAAAKQGRLRFADGGVLGSKPAPPGISPGPGVGAVGKVGGGLLGAVSGILSGASNLISDLNPMHWYDWLKGKFTGVLHLLDRFTDTAVGRIIAGVPGGLVHGMLGAAKSDLERFIGGLVPHIGGPDLNPLVHGVLIKAALAAAGVPDTADAEDAVNIIVSNESGWDPTIVNRTDSNWLAGHPSVGLMQEIASTYQSWIPRAMRNIGPWLYGVTVNPLANLVSGIRYAVGTYGSLDNVPGVLAVRAGEPYVGYDAGGLLEPGYTPVWNGTGKAEVVAPRATFDQLVNGRGGSAVAAFEGNLYLDSGEFLGRVRGEANQIVDKRVDGAQHAALQGVSGGVLGALASPHARAVSGGR